MNIESLTPAHPTSPHDPTDSDAAPAEALRAACPVHLAGDPGYDQARAAWNLAADQRPAAVALPRTVDEVAAAVAAAAAARLRVAPQSSGHGAAALAAQDLRDVVLLRLTELTGVDVDPAAGTARILGATPWGEVVAAAASYGLTALHGSAPDVAAAGYLLGGGLSFYGRQYGVAANSLRAVELVLADGSLVRADAEHHAELFWAVRGGGGGYGVVVALEIELFPHADAVAGMMLWDRERAPEVLSAWLDWTRQAPESATTTWRVMSFPPLPELPPFLSGRDIVVIDGALLTDDATAADLLAPLRGLTPEMDTFARVPAAAVTTIHMDPPAPTPAVSDHLSLGALDAAAAATLLALVGPGTRSDLLFTELRHLGGAFGRAPQGAGAMARLPGEYALHTVAVAPTPEAAVAGRAAGFAVLRAMEPWAVAGLSPTFVDAPTAAERIYPPDVLARLRQVREAVDPGRTMVANHPL